VDLKDVRRVHPRDGLEITVLDGITLRIEDGEFLSRKGRRERALALGGQLPAARAARLPITAALR